MKYNEFLIENVILIECLQPLNEFSISDLWHQSVNNIKDTVYLIKHKIIKKLNEYFSDCGSKNIEEIIEPITLSNGDVIESKEIAQYILGLYKKEIESKSISNLAYRVINLDNNLISNYYIHVKQYKNKEDFINDLHNIDNVKITKQSKMDESVITNFTLLAKMCLCLVVAPIILNALEPAIHNTQAYSQEIVYSQKIDYESKTPHEMDVFLTFMQFDYNGVFGVQAMQKKYKTKYKELESNIQKLKKMDKKSTEYKELLKQTNKDCNTLCSTALEELNKKDDEYKEYETAKKYYTTLRKYNNFFFPKGM